MQTQAYPGVLQWRKIVLLVALSVGFFAVVTLLTLFGYLQQESSACIIDCSADPVQDTSLARAIPFSLTVGATWTLCGLALLAFLNWESLSSLFTRDRRRD